MNHNDIWQSTRDVVGWICDVEVFNKIDDFIFAFVFHWQGYPIILTTVRQFLFLIIVLERIYFVFQARDLRKSIYIECKDCLISAIESSNQYLVGLLPNH